MIYDLKNVEPCVCDDYYFPHIHCGTCKKPISLDGKILDSCCEFRGFHPPPLTLKNDWCDCVEEHVNHFVAKNSCSCGCTFSHEHCLCCGKITRVADGFIKQTHILEED